MPNLYFTTIVPKGLGTYYITWKLDIPEKQEIRAECTNASVNKLNFQFKIVYFKDDENDLDESRLYFCCRNKVYIISVTFTQEGYEKEFNLCDDYMVTKPYEWLYITAIDRSKLSTINLEITTIFKEKIFSPFMLQSRLCSDFKNLFHLGSFSDAIMKSADGKEYNVHKAFLASRSPVLKAHFEHNTTESITNILESPLESEVLHELITFIYTDEAPNLAEMPAKLLAGANFYQLDRLKGLSEEVLYDKLTVDNALETLQLAELYSCENLKQLTLQFISDKAKLVIKTETWPKMISLELIKNLFEHMAEQNN